MIPYMPNAKQYVLFEGIDGSGKTSLVQDVGEHMHYTLKFPCLVTREPGSTADPVCAKIRDILKGGYDIDTHAEVFLFMADRAQHRKFVVEPALQQQKIVLQDRGFLSTYAYQGFGRSWSHHTIKRFNSMCAKRPDLIVMMNTPLDVAWERVKSRQGDQFEARDFQTRVQHGFDTAMMDRGHNNWKHDGSAWPFEPPPVLYIDGSKDRATNVAAVVEAILHG